ncbi:MAG TPA: hypothetical protein VHQ66_14460 [Myxococcota bacterium]|nr:hypothetical protein [Myxococcota bacterium]
MRTASLARAALLASAAAAAAAAPGAARPTYFQVLTGKYGFVEGDRLYACGVCHYRWEGTGARNPFGSTVEQELYNGKPISAAIDAAVPLDPDEDGFTSLEELTVHETLPGFSCDNFFESIDPPPDWHTFITPFVPSCLEPKDIRANPVQVVFQTDARSTESQTVTIFNNGKDDPIEVTSYVLGSGAHTALSLSGPPAPFTLEVGETAVLDVTFAPTGAVLAETTIEIDSDDPDEATLLVGLTAIGRVQPLAPPDARSACLDDLDAASRSFAKHHLKEWARCQGDEVGGFVCDAGARDRKLLGASGDLHAAVGGEKDRRCEGADLTPRLVGHEERCGGGCDAIALSDFTGLADCLACRQEEATSEMLAAAVGAAPPDLPPVAGSRDAAKCASNLLKGMQKGIAKAQSLLGRCELENTTAAAPVECTEALGADLEGVRADVDAKLARCKDTTGLAGCYVGPAGTSTCLGDAAVAIASDLVDATFGLDEE